MDKRSIYIRGIGVGLIIAWVTSALADYKAGSTAFITIILFELVLSIIFILASYFINTEKGKAK